MQPDYMICDDTYDWGDRAVSYRAAPIHDRLRQAPGRLEADSDLNRVAAPSGLWLLRAEEPAVGADGRGPPKTRISMSVLRAIGGEEVTISVLQGGGRAHQHAFVTIDQDYDDLFPDFGFPRSALMAPGKAVTAALAMPVRPSCYLWRDGSSLYGGGGHLGPSGCRRNREAGGFSRCPHHLLLGALAPLPAAADPAG